MDDELLVTTLVILVIILCVVGMIRGNGNTKPVILPDMVQTEAGR